MAVSKVSLNGNVLIDISDTTATANQILIGYGAYGADGAWVNGALSGGSGDNFLPTYEVNCVDIDTSNAIITLNDLPEETEGGNIILHTTGICNGEEADIYVIVDTYNNVATTYMFFDGSEPLIIFGNTTLEEGEISIEMGYWPPQNEGARLVPVELNKDQLIIDNNLNITIPCYISDKIELIEIASNQSIQCDLLSDSSTEVILEGTIPAGKVLQVKVNGVISSSILSYSNSKYWLNIDSSLTYSTITFTLGTEK